MKADDITLKKAAELGILRSMPDFLQEQLKPGRLKRRFMEIGIIIDGELRKIYNYNPTFFTDNKQELTVYLERFGKVTEWGDEKKNVHIASVVAFCLAFLEVSKSNFNPKLIELLTDILDYYERADKLKYSDLWDGAIFSDKWEATKN